MSKTGQFNWAMSCPSPYSCTRNKRSRSTLITQTKYPPLDETYKTSASLFVFLFITAERNPKFSLLSSPYAHIRRKIVES
ncbi:hypothetical protein CMV_005647 [Castanea mollissima]|uniref:Uncharacterized protein n=1 Tax=Castanea mollissima TaxID=60419 RepID=A0A8J4RPY5_9ROSI|nr:hypothetical protein CMV_005647 [Castanea mollissima]